MISDLLKARSTWCTFDYWNRKEVFACGFVQPPQARKIIRTSFPTSRILYLLNGRGLYTDHLGNSYRLSPGDMVYRAANTVHTIEREIADWHELYIVLPGFIHENLTRMGVLKPDETYFQPGLNADLLVKIRQNLDMLKYGTPLEIGDAVVTIEKILLLLLRVGKSSASVRTAGETMLQRARILLDDAVEKRMPMTEVAKKIGMGYESFRKVFRRKSGLSPHEYCIGQRIKIAQQLLLNHELEIKEIADQLGYKDASAFVKQFKSVSGQTPRQYRITGTDFYG